MGPIQALCKERANGQPNGLSPAQRRDFPNRTQQKRVLFEA
jgi:hypothetical protein